MTDSLNLIQDALAASGARNISQAFQKELFQPFSREQTQQVGSIQDTGRGRAIRKNIVDMMGGNIRVLSQEGAGSEFIVTLQL